MELKDFLKLAGQQGKVMVIDEDGNLKGFFLSADEYKKLAGNFSGEQKEKTAEQLKESVVEKVNREILQAQLEEVISSDNGGTAAPMPQPPVEVEHTAERIDSLLSKRAQDLFKSMPANFNSSIFPEQNFPPMNFKTPEVATADEEIDTNFDDI